MALSKAYGLGRPVYLVDGCRTPFLKARGTPGDFRASDLAVLAGRALLLRQPFDPAVLDEVILGCAMPRVDEANIARVAALRLGIGNSIPAWTVQRNCGSGLQALDAAAMNIASGRSDLILAGGAEAMSHAPVLLSDAMVDFLAQWRHARGLRAKLSLVFRLRPEHIRPVFSLARGLTDPIVELTMGQTAESLAFRFGISRERMDAYAVESHRRLARAQDEGCLEEIVPLYAEDGRFIDKDDGLRRDANPEGLSRLRPVFDLPYGLVTPGNSAQITDGAAWLILASEDAVAKFGLPVAGRIISCTWAGLDPRQMGLGPVHAISRILIEQGLKASDVDYWEINEAFAAQILACLDAWTDPEYCRDELGLKEAWASIDPARLNVDGGALAIGHPVGASGTRIVLHLLRVLARNGARRGIASLCVGGGQGGAMLIERC
jgi:acetyl-CoA C-acetyltransferase